VRLDLEHVAIPEETAAEERTWQVVGAAYTERVPSTPRPQRARLLVGIATACITAALVAVAVSPAGSGLLHSIRREIGLAHAAPALTRLPAQGALLVTSKAGPWLVQPDGSKRLLGRYAQASLSPHGLFVAVTRRHELLAVDPQGNVRWSIARLRPISLPRWAPDGYRIAYLDGSTLRIVAGDGTGDHGFADAVAHVAPAWRPSNANEHVLAFSSAGRELELYSVDGNVLYARHKLASVPLQLLWSSDGTRLVALSTHELSVFDHNGSPLGTIHIGRRALAAAFAPHTHELTVILNGARSDAVAFNIDKPGVQPREVFSGSGHFSALTWSPDGRWLLIAWPTANQWLFVSRNGRATAVADIAAQFQGNQAPAPAGWCC
jgi:hypothetical protein